ncbi:MAG: electron transport complex subunit RsxE [Actinomycetota bacterium]|nr:electron transport complex subunit RsxE [Actinomycetota bacterium]
MKRWFEVFQRGLSIDNPLTVLMIGLCATLAVSTKFDGALFMGAAVIFVLTMSSAIVSALRRLTPEQVRIPIFIVVIASFVTIVDLTMHAFLPGVYGFLGVWIPLIVVNCIILGRAEAFAYNNTVSLSIADGLGMGIGYSVIIVLMAAFRELAGTGQIEFLGQRIIGFPEWYRGPSMILLFPGAFILFGFMIAGARALESRMYARKVETQFHCTIDEGGRA